jgi:hypothetical protein
MATEERADETAEETPSDVMERVIERYLAEGMNEHVRGRFRMALDALGEERVAKVFGEDIETQRELDGDDDDDDGEE